MHDYHKNNDLCTLNVVKNYLDDWQTEKRSRNFQCFAYRLIFREKEKWNCFSNKCDSGRCQVDFWFAKLGRVWKRLRRNDFCWYRIKWSQIDQTNEINVLIAWILIRCPFICATTTFALITYEISTLMWLAMLSNVRWSSLFLVGKRTKRKADTQQEGNLKFNEISFFHKFQTSPPLVAMYHSSTTFCIIQFDKTHPICCAPSTNSNYYEIQNNNNNNSESWQFRSTSTRAYACSIVFVTEMKCKQPFQFYYYSRHPRRYKRSPYPTSTHIIVRTHTNALPVLYRFAWHY